MSGTQKLLAGLITALALVALGVSSYLSWVTWQQSTVAGCTGGSEAGCDEVLTSSDSKWLGIPVSLLGAATYLAILATVWPAAMRGGWWMTSLLTLAMMAAGAGVWFIFSQAFIVKHFCLYCMTVHVCGLVICSLTVGLLRVTPGTVDYDPMRSFFAADEALPSGAATPNLLQPVIASGIASVGLAALIGGQVFFAPSGMEVVDIAVPETVEAVAAEEVAVPGGAGDPSAIAPVEESTERQVDAELPVEQSALQAEATQEALPDERPTRLADDDPAEPAGEAVVATDESADSPSEDSAEPLSVDQSFEAGGDVATGSGNKSFEELFGESPADTLLTPTSTTPVPRVFRFKYLKGDIDVENNPMLGNPYARIRMVELLDYTCPHCRKLHAYVKKAVERYGEQVGVVIYHVPLSRKCNELVKVEQTSHANACDLTRLALGVWKLAPEKFPEFHDWLMQGDRAPALHAVKDAAIKLVGLDILTDKSIDVESKRRVAEHARDMEALRVGLPVLIFEDGVIRGLPNSDQEWFHTLEQRVGLKAPAESAGN